MTIYGKELKGRSREYRNIFEDGSFKCQVYVRTRKEWKDTLIINKDECTCITNARHRKWIHEVYYTSYAASLHDRFYIDDEAFKALMEEMDKYLPQFKYWVKKLVDVDNCNWSILSVLMMQRDIPETESLLVMKHIRRQVYDYETMSWSNEYREKNEWYIGKYAASARWRRMSHSDRKKIINAYREWCNIPENHLWNHISFLPRDIVRAEQVLLHRDEPDFIVLGWDIPDCRRGFKVTNRDLDWLRRTFSPATDADLLHLAHEYLDWLRGIIDEVTDLNDPYFRYQMDWEAQHERQIQQREERMRANALIEEERSMRSFKERYGKWCDYVMEKDGWRIYLSDNLDQWKARAYALRQCIVSAKYYGMEGEAIIFMDYKGKPRYTAELILKSKEIGQFYGDERKGSKDLRPTAEAKVLMDEFIHKYF